MVKGILPEDQISSKDISFFAVEGRDFRFCIKNSPDMVTISETSTRSRRKMGKKSIRLSTSVVNGVFGEYSPEGRGSDLISIREIGPSIRVV